jgi:glutathionylspermidine synthase
MRFDFHPTPDGWRISEVNSDVPGGFSESSEFPAMLSEHFREYVPAGAPGPVLADALENTIVRHGGRECALVSAAGFMEDLQVVSYLARLLERRGVETHLGNPQHLRCDRGRLVMDVGADTVPLALVVRFHQAEWLSQKAHASIAPHLLGDSETPVVNPGHAVVGESKRLPLVWDELGLKMDAWRRLLPETRDPRDAPWLRDSGWLLKTAFCNTGDSVSSPLSLSRREWIRAAADAAVFPRHWVAQRRFEVVPLDTPVGAMYPCIGVYTIGGRACGLYGRLSKTPVVTYAAADVAVLIEKESE